MEEQYRIFDHDGVLIDQISTSVERAYAIATETTAKFALSVFDQKCNPHTLNYGNSILCENSDGLIPWVGMIDLLGFNKGVGLAWAFSPERWFAYRRGPRRLTLRGRAGDIFAQMIQFINRAENTPLAIGNIYSNTSIMEETLNPTLLNDNLKRIVERSGEAYRWRPEVVNGRLIIYGDWIPNVSIDNGLIFQDGYNITSDHEMSMYPPENDQLSYGSGPDWGTRIMSEALDLESIDRYGLRQGSTSVSVKAQASLDLINKLTLENFKDPQYNFPISALNVGDTFAKLAPGAMATFTQLVGQGFSNDGLGYLSENRMVTTMNFDPFTQKVGVAV